MIGNPPLYEESNLWEARSVVSQKWIPFPTALHSNVDNLSISLFWSFESGSFSRNHMELMMNPVTLDFSVLRTSEVRLLEVTGLKS